MKQPEYAADKYAVLNITLSLIVIVSVIVYEVHIGRFHFWRLFRALFAPALLIWIPDIIEGLDYDLFSSRVIRIVGWILLLIVVLVPIVQRALFSWEGY